MKFVKNIYTGNVRSIFILLSFFFLLITCCNITAQEPPPRPVEVTSTGQGLSFGTFCHGASGGTVTISSGGSRSATGDVVLLNMSMPYSVSYSTAQFKLVGNPGTVISILNGEDISLNRIGGGTMTLHIGDSDPISPFVITTDLSSYTLLNVGGSLTVSNPGANPPGDYSGTFEITFIQE
jgi:hypothetical protein